MMLCWLKPVPRWPHFILRALAHCLLGLWGLEGQEGRDSLGETQEATAGVLREVKEKGEKGTAAMRFPPKRVGHPRSVCSLYVR